MKRLVLIFLLLVSLPIFAGDAKYDSNRFLNAVVHYQEAIIVEELSRLDLTDRNEVEFMFKKALESHNLFFYQQILASGYDVNAAFEYNNTLLHEAVKVRDLDIINTLLNHGAYVNAVNDEGHTPLHLAALKGYEEISRLLVSNGAKGNPPYATDYDLLLGQAPVESVANGHNPYAKEQVSAPAQYVSERLQFVWKAPLQGRQTLWSIKTDGTDLRQVLDEHQLYARELGDQESELERAFRSPDNRYLLLYYSGRGEVVFYDLKTDDYVPVSETQERILLAPQWNTDNTVLVGINSYEYRELSYDKRNIEKAIRRENHHLYTFKDKTILNSGNGGISIVNAAGDTIRHVDVSKNCCKKLTERAISADEKYLLFTRSENLTIVNLQTMSVQMAEESTAYYSDPVFDANSRFAYVTGNKQINKIDIQTQKISPVFSARKKGGGSFEHLTKLFAGYHKDIITLVGRNFPDLPEHYDEDGNYYFGALSDGKYHGYGEWFNRYYMILGENQFRSRYVVSYKGEWLDGLYHGTGDLLMSDGSSYQGQWVQGKKHGSGIAVSVDGERYEGSWRDNKRHGRGICSGNDKSGDCLYFGGEVLTYSGETDQQGLRHGNGQASWGEGYTSNTYIGQWKNDKISGTGKLDGYASDKFTYKGSFKNDLFDGYGVYVTRFLQYSGHWGNGVYNGKGTLQKKNGPKLSGQWVNGSLKDPEG